MVSERHASGFGFLSETVTWIYPHKVAPAIFTKDVPRTLDWLNDHCEKLVPGENIGAFPKRDDETLKMVTPTMFERPPPIRLKRFRPSRRII